MDKFRDLKADEIECRIAMVKDNGLQLLLYKNARVDMNILDETVGTENWQREHYDCKGNLFCRVGIRIDNEWVWKADCGAESYTEKEKGESSDSFKRACTCWGIGRELYTSPFIWVPSSLCNIKGTKCYDRFKVTEIKIENKKITELEIVNETNKKIVYSTTTKSKPVANVKTEDVIANLKNQINTATKEIAKKQGTTGKKIYEKACAELNVKGETDVELTRIVVLLSKWLNE